MNWVDYCEKLGVGFSDNKKLNMLKNKVRNVLLNSPEIKYSSSDLFSFYHLIGHEYTETYMAIEYVVQTLNQCTTLREYIAHYVALINTFTDKEYEEYAKRSILNNIFQNALNGLKIPFETKCEGDEYYFFPKGAKELDDALVSQPLAWLEEYPNARKTFIIALKQYADGVYIRDVADNFRKSLEDFLKEFFGNSKNYSSNINEVGAYLKTADLDSEITNIYVGLCKSYDILNNKVAKHHDKVDSKCLEFLMYQTGLFIRMLIVVKESRISPIKKEES